MRVLESTLTSTEQVAGGGLLAGAASAVSCAAVEIVVMWNDIVQKVVQREVGDRKHPRFTIGEDPSCDFPVPAEHLAGMTSLTLVDIGGEEAVTSIPAGAGGTLISPGGQVLDLAELEQRRLTLLEGHKLLMEVGPIQFLVRATARQEKFTAPLRIDWTPNLFAGISVIVHAAFFAIISLIPPDATGLVNDPNAVNAIYGKYMIAPKEVRLDPIPDTLEKEDTEEEVDKGIAHEGPIGQMGDRRAPKKDKRHGIKGPPDTSQIRMARSTALDVARNAGILNYLSPQDTPTSPFGSDNPMGRDPENALGALVGNEIGASFGYGGLNMWGTGRGGGGDGIGTIGVGDLNSIGGGFIRPGKKKYRNPPELKDGDYKAKGIGVRTGGPVSTKGSISKATIRRLVQRQLPQIKYCYEKGLARSPDLEGRVSIRFVISGKGIVQTAAVAGSSLNDASVEQCIAKAVRRISFPQPEDGGVVIATYPFTLTSPHH